MQARSGRAALEILPGCFLLVQSTERPPTRTNRSISITKQRKEEGDNRCKTPFKWMFILCSPASGRCTELGLLTEAFCTNGERWDEPCKNLFAPLLKSWLKPTGYDFSGLRTLRSRFWFSGRHEFLQSDMLASLLPPPVPDVDPKRRIRACFLLFVGF